MVYILYVCVYFLCVTFRMCVHTFCVLHFVCVCTHFWKSVVNINVHDMFKYSNALYYVTGMSKVEMNSPLLFTAYL